jgi:phosphonopyruvate decarboxylase
MIDFSIVGSMGHCSQIAVGAASVAPAQRGVCLDGDGTVIRHMGALAIIGQPGAENLLHIVLNNGRHDSVGGQLTVGVGINLAKLALACGYLKTVCVSSGESLREEVRRLVDSRGPIFMEVRVRGGARCDQGRPASGLVESRDALMKHLFPDEG